MKKIRVTLIKSLIDRPKNQRLNATALGLGKMHSSVEHT
ncbi:MAG: hypothetical protein CVU11_08270 [Bacteroidetes bacterium HGW-Bacteroidetes-6]|nr:MAG: hypothetical protein CVU11_08270 [Bacteroidetes bacterium HGW-Bacteroidetes-6]